MASEPQWYDDPCFESFEETFCNITFTGEHWRRLMELKENFGITRAFSVAGTSFHEPELRRAITHAQTKGEMRLLLVKEASNPHDPNAVRVEINNQHVGYIPRRLRVPHNAEFYIAKYGLHGVPHVIIAH